MQNRSYSMSPFFVRRKKKKTHNNPGKKCHAYPVTISKLLAFFLRPISLLLSSHFPPLLYLFPVSTCSDVAFPFNNLFKYPLIHPAIQEGTCTESWKSNSFPLSPNPAKNGCLLFGSSKQDDLMGEKIVGSVPLFKSKFSYLTALDFQQASELLFPHLCNEDNAYLPLRADFSIGDGTCKTSGWLSTLEGQGLATSCFLCSQCVALDWIGLDLKAVRVWEWF